MTDTPDEKPREWWFEYMSETKEYGQLSDRPPYVRDNSFELVHVIERSAYAAIVRERDEFQKMANKMWAERDALRAEVEEWQDLADERYKEIKTLRAERDRLRAALERIADMTEIFNTETGTHFNEIARAALEGKE